MTDNHLVLDGNGIPLAFVDVDQIQAAATTLGFDLAAAAHDPEQVEQVLAAVLTKHGDNAFGYITASALRHVVANILNPVLEVTDELHKYGHLAHDLRAGLADAARNARETLQ